VWRCEVQEVVGRSGGFSLTVGLDWSDAKHDVAERRADTDKVSSYKLSNTPEAVAEWLAGLDSRRGGGRVGVCMEACPGFLRHMLEGCGFVDLYALNPSMASKYRSALHPSGAKDDPSDAALLLDMVHLHRDALRMAAGRGDVFAAIEGMVAARRSMVDERTGLVQALQAVLKSYYPQALELCGDLDGAMACRFIARWPSVHALRKARPQTLAKFYRDSNSRSDKLIEARLAAAAAAVAPLPDGAFCAAKAMEAVSLARRIELLGREIRKFDDMIAVLFASCPDAGVFNSLPGAGPALAPRLMVAMGEDKDAYADAGEVQNAVGISPVMIRSGKCVQVRFRRQCSKFERQTFHEFASHSINNSSWAKEFYMDRRRRGAGHNAAVRALAYKWIRIIFRCWKSGVPYDEERYVRSLIEKGSPIGLALKKEVA
jgi:hypothetical protein